MTQVSEHELIDKLLDARGTVMLLGGIDTGKTGFGLALAESARRAGIDVAYVDSDIGQSTVGPPSCVGLKFCRDLETVDRDSVAAADELGFVGSFVPEDNLLALVASTARLVGHARQAGCEMVVVDTCAFISGPDAEELKYHKLDLTRPAHVVGFQRGEELEPILAIADRFFSVEVTGLKVPGDRAGRSAEERLTERQTRFAGHFAEPLSRWRVKPTVFMPTLAQEDDLSRLDGLLVGLEDGLGRCHGIGLLEYQAQGNILRMVSSVSSGAKGLRLGSVRLTTEGRTVGRYPAQQFFGD